MAIDSLHQRGSENIVSLLQISFRRAEYEPNEESADMLRVILQRLQQPLDNLSLAWACAQLRSFQTESIHSKRAQRIPRDLFVSTTTKPLPVETRDVGEGHGRRICPRLQVAQHGDGGGVASSPSTRFAFSGEVPRNYWRRSASRGCIAQS